MELIRRMVADEWRRLTTASFFLLALLFHAQGIAAQDFIFRISDTGTSSNFRGLSAVNDSVVWISGTDGTVCRSIDGGNQFDCMVVPGCDTLDFRSVYAFSDSSVIIANAGTPAKIFRTDDAGKSWSVVYENDHKDAFINGIDFWNEKEGVCYGDPMMGLMLMLKTQDGGWSWRLMHPESRPLLVDNEFSFAASGTGIRCYDTERLMISTGGEISRLLYSDNQGITWRQMLPPIIQGKNSTGIFSFAFRDTMNGVIVGGDYLIDTLSTQNAFYTVDGGLSWTAPETTPRGYRECVTYLNNDTLFTCGPTGIDISTDGGASWKGFSDEKGFHVMRKARSGSLLLLAGKRGRVGVISIH
jgi:photosystem II stability/assembly factor-like uncharacterized protein